MSPTTSSRNRLRLFAVFVPLTSLALCLALLEVGLRWGIYSDTFRVDAVRKASYFADAQLDSDFWKLDYLFEDDGKSSSGADETPQPPPTSPPLQVAYGTHPLLGWAPRKSERNPLGIVTDRPYTPASLEPTVLFFGDSYVDG